MINKKPVISPPFSTILVAEDNSKIVGFLVYWILFDNSQICNICVIVDDNICENNKEKRKQKI